ncbi:hypothetical protein AVEN_25891-1 [Araneus ventricosus]|uniref:Uncharacterized protein n=1 Tax=Araneus ventricosus TaxID=182803 RepID=A0A4Y2F8C3_ARAVE|nr:hypothetical protein AVEN_25891-1 [Araneus ventricosus]
MISRNRKSDYKTMYTRICVLTHISARYFLYHHRSIIIVCLESFGSPIEIPVDDNSEINLIDQGPPPLRRKLSLRRNSIASLKSFPGDEFKETINEELIELQKGRGTRCPSCEGWERIVFSAQRIA